MKKLLLTTLALATLALSGCQTVKNMMPNGWNLTFYQPTDGNRDGQQVAVGISGALPFGKQ